MDPSIKQLIDEVLTGQEISDVITSVVEGTAEKAMVVRKRIRQTAPRLYQWLSDGGFLHDFALDMASGRMSRAEHYKHKYSVPASMIKDVALLLER